MMKQPVHGDVSQAASSPRRPLKRHRLTRLRTHLRRRLRRYTRNRTVVGTVLVLGIVAAMATHFAIEAGHLFGLESNARRVAASAQSIYSFGSRFDSAEQRSRHRANGGVEDGPQPVLYVVGSLVLESLQEEIVARAELYRSLAAARPPAKRLDQPSGAVNAPVRRTIGKKRRGVSQPPKPSQPPDDESLGSLAESMIIALTTESYTLNFKKHSYKRRYSLRYLHDSGALEDNLSGYRRLVDMAYGTDQQPFAVSALFEVSPMKWTEAETDAVRNVQRYMREYGPRLVSMGRLDP